MKDIDLVIGAFVTISFLSGIITIYNYSYISFLLFITLGAYGIVGYFMFVGGRKDGNETTK